MRFQCFVIIFLLVLVSENGTNNSSLFSVGTVLFRASDSSKHCWTEENIALLTSRMLMANLMPHADVLTAEDDTFTSDIIEYFRLLLETIRQNTEGKTKHIMLMAATDTIGGYMTHLILPITKYSFYAGNIQYASIMRLYQLYDELKHFLQTNGNGWAKPWKKAGKNIQAKSISMQYPPCRADPCKGLVYHKRVERTEKPNPPKVHIDIPMPFFDSRSHPAAIAVPFRSFGLRNLQSRASAYVVVKYYVAVSKCMASRNVDETDMHKFDANIFDFINNKIIPHLGDEQFYAAFGGVLRILQTVTETTKAKGMVMGNVDIMADIFDKEGDNSPDDDNEDTANAYHSNRNRNNLIVLAALATIVIWFCLGAAFVCCRIKAGKINKQKEGDENVCDPTTCPQLTNQYTSATSSDYESQFDKNPKVYNVKQKQSKVLPGRSSKKSIKSKGSKSNSPSKDRNAIPTDSGSDKSPFPQTKSQSFVNTRKSPGKHLHPHKGRSSPVLSPTSSPRKTKTSKKDKKSPPIKEKKSPPFKEKKSPPPKEKKSPRSKEKKSSKPNKKSSSKKEIEEPSSVASASKADDTSVQDYSAYSSRLTPQSPANSSPSYRSPSPSNRSPRSSSKRSTPRSKSSKTSLSRSRKSSPRSSKSSKNSKASRVSETSQTQRPPQIQVHSVQYYPPTFSCHTSMVGRTQIVHSDDESEDPMKRPYVFGYDFQTSSESSPNEGANTDDNDVTGNISK